MVGALHSLDHPKPTNSKKDSIRESDQTCTACQLPYRFGVSPYKRDFDAQSANIHPLSLSLAGGPNLHPIHHSSVFILHLLATAAHVQSLTPRSWNCCCFSTGQARIRIVMVSRKQSSPDLLRATVLGMEVFFIVLFLVLLIIITKQIRLKKKTFTNLSSHKSLDMIPNGNPPSKKKHSSHTPTCSTK